MERAAALVDDLQVILDAAVAVGNKKDGPVRNNTDLVKKTAGQCDNALLLQDKGRVRNTARRLVVLTRGAGDQENLPRPSPQETWHRAHPLRVQRWISTPR